MTVSIPRLVQDIFKYNYHYTSLRCYYLTPGNKYMEIPILDDEFEIPLFALRTFLDIVERQKDLTTDAIVANLSTAGRSSNFKSIDRNMRDILVSVYNNERLIRFFVQSKQVTFKYYGTFGAIFDKDFNPVAVASWIVRREKCEDNYKYHCIKPIIHVSPGCMEQSDPLQRWVCNKMIPAAFTLNHTIDVAHSCFITDRNPKEVTVEIGGFPLKIVSAECPVVSTTNQEIADMAAKYIEEIII